MALREGTRVRRLFRSHIDRSRMTLNLRDETGSRFDHSGGSHSHIDRALIECVAYALQFERDLAKPADVGPNQSAALASGEFRRRLIGVRVAKGWTGAGVAAALEQFAMHVHDLLRPSLLVQIVDVLGAQKQAVAQRLFEFCECEMRGIRLGLRGNRSAHGIELPHQSRITPPGMRRCDFLDPVVAPMAANSAERRDPTLGADPGPGQHE